MSFVELDPVVDSDVVNVHALGERRAGVGIAGPVATDSNVHEEEEWTVIEHPFVPRALYVVQRDCEVVLSVHEEFDCIGVPRELEDVVGVGE